MTTTLALTPGDRLPDFVLPETGGEEICLYDEARGGLLVLVTVRHVAGAEGVALLRRLRVRARVDRPARAHCFAITTQSASACAGLAEIENFPGFVLCDDGGRVAGELGLDAGLTEGSARALVLDPNQRVLWAEDGHGEALADAAFDFVDALQLFTETGRPRDLAPVVMVPRAFEPEFCQRLIRVFHDLGNEESGVYGMVDGQLAHRIDHSIKSRFDHHLRDEGILEEVRRRLSRRVVPEIEKACWFSVSRAEEFKIVCYRADTHGFFCAHRDNYTPQTAHRRFAMTLNLNTGEYEGGALRFPEYGNHLYEPRLGEAVAFSCSLLHEATPVTRGERYVLLAFLFDEDGERQRKEIDRALAEGA